MYEKFVETIGEYAHVAMYLAIALGIFLLLHFLAWDVRARAVARERKKEGKGPLTKKDKKALKRLIKYSHAKRRARMKQRFNSLLKKLWERRQGRGGREPD